MKDIIKKIIQGEECEDILNLTLNRIYKSGLCSYSDMEILSYLALYRRDLTENRLNEIVSFMALYYKGHVEPLCEIPFLGMLGMDSIAVM